MKSPQQAKADLRFQGKSMADWARENGFNPDLVRRVLLGRLKCWRGESHKIAVKLGMKEGIIRE